MHYPLSSSYSFIQVECDARRKIMGFASRIGSTIVRQLDLYFKKIIPRYFTDGNALNHDFT